MIVAALHHHGTLTGGLGVAAALATLAALPVVPAFLSRRRDGR